MSGRVVYFNGEFIPETEARVSIFDSALMFGDMVFEVTRSFAQAPFRLREHLERLYASMDYAEIDCGLSIDQMEEATRDTIKRNLPVLGGLDFQILHDVSRGALPVYDSIVKEGTAPIVVIHVFPLIRHVGSLAESFEKGAHVVVPRQQSVPARYIDPKAKNRSRLFYQVAINQATRMAPGAQPLLTDERGCITEGAGSNFFMVRAGKILTPNPRDILRGVSRGACMEFAEGLGIPVRETDIEPYDVRAADEAWSTSTPFAMLPITRFDFRPLGDGRPGPIYRKILTAWSEAVGVDIAAQAAEYAELAKTWKP